MDNQGPLQPLIEAIKGKLTPEIASHLDQLHGALSQLLGKATDYEMNKAPIGAIAQGKWGEVGPRIENVMGGPMTTTDPTTGKITVTPAGNKMMNNMTIGATMGGDMSNWVPRPAANFAQSTTPGADIVTNPSNYTNAASMGQPTAEQMIEKAGGWSPGMRAQFDTAMLMKDAPTVQKLLPMVPNEYKVRFAQEIMNLLPK